MTFLSQATSSWGLASSSRLPFRNMLLTPRGGPWCLAPRAHQIPVYLMVFSAIPADDLRVLCDHGSRQLYPRFDHPFPSFEATSTIRHARVSRCKQTHRAIEA